VCHIVALDALWFGLTFDGELAKRMRYIDEKEGKERIGRGVEY
jgi:uncharacterized protein YlaN (UPF0358 family)